MGYFGVKWDSLAFEDAVKVATPLGEKCLYCEEPITYRESGVFMGFVHAEGESGIRPAHIECHLRSVMGSVTHLEMRCSCFGGTEDHADTRPYRRQAIETHAWLIERGR